MEPDLIADLFEIVPAGVDNNYIIFKVLNRKTVHEVKGDLCLFRFNFINDEIEIIEIVNKDEILTEDPVSYFYMWVIHNDKFYIFDEGNETLLIYKIRKEGK